MPQEDRFGKGRVISEYAGRGILPQTPNVEQLKNTIIKTMRPGVESVRILTPVEINDLLHRITSRTGGIT